MRNKKYIDVQAGHTYLLKSKGSGLFVVGDKWFPELLDVTSDPDLNVVTMLLGINMIKNLLFSLFFLVSLSGCATPVINGPMFTKALNPPKADMGTLYVFRAKGGLGEAAYMAYKN